MVFKLVRIDGEESNKIQLPLGTHLIGRGKFLDCEDKRISRNHGHLTITEVDVVIEALHQNPCFYTKKGSEEKQVLKKSSKEVLGNGDRFGLLPGSYWYEVLHCTTETDSQATDVSNTEEHDPVESKPNQGSQIDKTLQIDNDENVHSNVNAEKRIEGGGDEDSVLNFDLNETVENTGRSESPSLLDKQNESQLSPLHPMPSSPNPTEPTNPPETTEGQTNQPESVPEQLVPESTSKSPKRSHSLDADDGVKRIKTEPVEVKEELLVKQEPDASDAGPSSGQAAQAGASNTADGKAPPSPVPAPPRERCLYGADCYRRNPVHKAQFSHPRDPDWGDGDQAPCPYGAACRKRDPRHWRLHSHPPQARMPAPGTKPRAQKRQRSQRRSESVSGSDYNPGSPESPQNLVLTTKRVRKPLPKLDSQDSENEDPFASDGSDDWVPPSDYTETQDYD